MTTTQLLLLISIICLTACADSNYHGENYQAFDSMEELTNKIVSSIKTQDEAAMLVLLDNEQLLLDLLNGSTGEKARKTKAFFATKGGQRKLSVNQLSKKQRINAFFSLWIPKKIKINQSAFKATANKLISEDPYSDNLPAKVQKYQIQLDNGEKKSYTYDIQVIFWNDKYHLIEAAGFLN